MNVILTGFMATGKSKVGKEVARLLKMKFIDTDDLIEKKVGMKISEIFANEGEEYFRNIESEIAKEVGSLDHCVVATGGGIVVRQKNIDNLTKNGKIIYLSASVKKILERVCKNSDRPLLNTKNKKSKIEKLLAKREPYYKKNDFSVDTTNTTPIEAAKKIIEYIHSNKI